MKYLGVAIMALALTLIFAPLSQAREIKRYDVPVADSPYLGPEDAAVTIIEFLDYQ